MSTLPLQAQSFTLTGGGASIGDTSIILNSCKMIDGTTNITMAMLGTLAYMTLDPNNGSQEEQISFTGLVQNANGTATLSGVKTVLFQYPYTASSGLAKAHTGNATAILSDTSAYYNQLIQDIISGIGYGNADSTTFGMTKLTIDPASAGDPIAVGANNSLSGTAISSTNKAVDAAFSLSGTALSSGNKLVDQASLATTSTNDAVVRANSSGIIDSSFLSIAWKGLVGSGATSYSLSTASGTQTIAHGLGYIPKLVRIRAVYSNGVSASSPIITCTAETIYSASTQSSVYVFSTWATTGSTANGNTFSLLKTTTDFQTGVVTTDSTNITITWTKTASPTGTAYMIWDALA